MSAALQCQLPRDEKDLAALANDDLLGAMSASIAHEISQPIAAILANADACHHWLSAEQIDRDHLLEVVERIRTNAVSVSKILTALRCLFTCDPGARVAGQINESIGEVCTLLADEIAGCRVDISLRLDPAAPILSFEPAQIQQLLINLVRNAIEAMESVPVPRKLTISSQRECGGSRVDIIDEGVGIPDPERMFDASFSTKAKGRGMGLAICRRIVEAHDGRLWSEPGEARGTRMIFTLPDRGAPIARAVQ
jgi:C4-dicarboxylate-specific signal transduction histidine kinase